MNDIINYIPQRPPFVMIDTLISTDEVCSKTSFTIPHDHFFVEDGFFIASGLVENMAQTAAAGTGFKAFHSGTAAPVGFIGALKNLLINTLPKSGATITTTVNFGMQVLNAQIVQASIMQDQMEIASCELKIFIQP